LLHVSVSRRQAMTMFIPVLHILNIFSHQRNDRNLETCDKVMQRSLAINGCWNANRCAKHFEIINVSYVSSTVHVLLCQKNKNSSLFDKYSYGETRKGSCGAVRAPLLISRCPYTKQLKALVERAHDISIMRHMGKREIWAGSLT
jgi:hypothetical protein